MYILYIYMYIYDNRNLMFDKVNSLYVENIILKTASFKCILVVDFSVYRVAVL